MKKPKLLHPPETRPCDFDVDELSPVLTRMASEGLSWLDMSKELHCTPAELYLSVRGSEELTRAVATGTAVCASRVEGALLKKALGYSYEEVTQELVGVSPEGEDVYKETKRVTKEVQPDVAAIKLYLENRDPERWQKDALLQVNTIQITAEDKRDAAMKAIAEVLEGNK